MSTENSPSIKKPSSGAIAIGGIGGLSSILIAFANIEFKDSEYLTAITSTIPFVVSIAIGGLEYAFSYIGARNKSELQIDAKLKRKLKNVDKYIKQTRKNIGECKKLQLDTTAEEESLKALLVQRQEIQLAHLNVDDITAKPVPESK
ncbi:TPA: hypothetical protein RQK75_002251 [Vibrio vulnificus]|nr:hypothetical protein [Vibrio vulnificus]